MNRLIRTTLAVSLFVLSAGAPPRTFASESKHYDDACTLYYESGNDPNVMSTDGWPATVCQCMADHFVEDRLPFEALLFYTRTYLEDVTTFIHEYPQGDYWMERQYNAYIMCTTG